jgi:hypothetical protein
LASLPPLAKAFVAVNEARVGREQKRTKKMKEAYKRGWLPTPRFLS